MRLDPKFITLLFCRVVARLASLMQVGGVFAVALMVVAQSPTKGEEMLFDRGLPAEHLNNVPGQASSNVRFGEVTLVEIVHNLNEAGFLTGEVYHRALREVEQGSIQLRSRLLQLIDNAQEREISIDGEIVIYATYVVADEDFSEAELEAFIEEFEESERQKCEMS